MSELRAIDGAMFDQVVLGSDRPVLVDFWAQWCPPCHLLVPILADIAAERSDKLTIVKVNADENPEVSGRYRLMALPTMIIFHRGEPIWSVVGARPKARLLRDIDEVMATIAAAV